MNQRIAIIDLGSNSARLIIVEIYPNRSYNLIYHQKDAVRLGQEADKNRQLQPEAMIRTMNLLKSFAHMCQIFHTEKILGVGTAALRNAANGSEFVKKIQEETGISITIISGEVEAKLGYLGAINTLDVADAILFDLGGGSTELTLIKERKAIKVTSLPFGAVTLTERFKLENKATEAQLTALNEFLSQELAKVPWLRTLNLPLIGIGGTARSIGKMEQKRNHYPLLKLHNYRTSSYSFHSLWEDVIKMSCAQRRKIAGLSSERADIIISGLAIVKHLFEKIDSTQLIISSCGVREGLFLQYYLSQTGQAELLDPLSHSTDNMLSFYRGNTKHSNQVAKLANGLFDDWQEVLGLQPRSRTLLQVAALLHDIGIAVSYYDHARHSAYLIENARLFGLSHREQIMAAIIAGWHHSPSVKYSYNRIYNEFLDAANWQTARKLALLLALAESLDTTQMSLAEKITTSISKKQAQLIVTTKQELLLELQAVKKHSKWFKRETGLELTVSIAPF
ncbi:exopolyphosphatase [Pelosinus propionicus]|uniref:Chaperone protein DnaK n=1 Tax=Pelosinus propionicus DSM 13327 TaxID=1123291 RepID=A0A1I4LZ01_9FIRM|nr:exopolyphosphatase [Pelosinus propionicus]SFL95967.1 exopolyphosphatase / guanosine-5'-triphosphate,3'-diphosphate pyrophosphatase [Pelosinus propionicus DSM 13327]